MEEQAHDQSHDDLHSFNNSIVHLTELINANLNDPERDVQELTNLRSKVDYMLEMVQGMIRTKSEKIVQEVIPNYFVNLASTTPNSPQLGGVNRKRKMVTFEVEEVQR